MAVDEQLEKIEKKETKVCSNDSLKLAKNSDIITDALEELFSESKIKPKSKKYKGDLSIRKDVVNKNILRIISRYYKEILNEKFPDFKHTFKNSNAIEGLLSDFWNNIFPENFDSDLKYSLGAFVIAPKMKILDMRGDKKSPILRTITQIHKILSKYTHKDLEKLVALNEKYFTDISEQSFGSKKNFNWWKFEKKFSSQHFNEIKSDNCENKQQNFSPISVIFSNFFEKGMNFFNQQETVQKNKIVYYAALNNLKMRFTLQRDS